MRQCFLYIALITAASSFSPAKETGIFFENPSDSNVKISEMFIGKIIIAGNEITDEDIITRELSIKEDSRLDMKMLEEDVERIYRLGLFNKVDVIPVPTDTANKINIMFLVEERFYFLPIPQGGFRNGEFSKFWAGMNIVWNNFRGRNENLGLSFGIGYEPFVNLNYSVPWIGKTAHYFSSVSFSYSKSYNRSLKTLDDTLTNSIPSSENNYENYNFGAGLTLGKYYSRNFSVNGGLRFNIVETSQYEPERTVSSDGKDEYLTFSAAGKFDTRNSSEYTLLGSYYSLEYVKFGFGKLMDFNKVNFEARKFIPIKLTDEYVITYAARFFGTLSFGGTIPTYLKEYFGYDNLVRGYKKVVFEGENKTGIYNELRIPVITPFYIKGKSIPLAKRIGSLKNLNYKLGLYATVFFDIGGIWNKTDNFFNTRFRNGYGAGLNFIMPFGLTFRSDFAFRKEGKKYIPQVIFDLGSSF